MINGHGTRIYFPKSTVLISLLLVLFAYSSCQNKTSDIKKLFAKVDFSEDKAKEVMIIFSENAIVQARLFATEFIINEHTDPPFMDARNGLRIESFDDSTRIQSTLTARYARYYPETGNILVRDSVYVINEKGEELRTEELIWNDKLKKFYTEKYVRIKTASQIMYGDGLEANQDFSWYQLTNIKGIIEVSETEVP